ncbi:hypothetical protein GU927_019055 [Rhodobacteraceae bacterium HSP-20]|uniref:CTP synthetase n=1 Tax=Paragemmobacter amnigenus TaxID=2852097 RepID=A0ABS6JC31_9RHOB|nr:hypothetical protein [Rhodobacter amnigenus]MBU9699945.1 hypothetical protein [Rhodobacter amnigenus]MBV4391172.1 hypothetical protein [Rhodobacter amnigenus]
MSRLFFLLYSLVGPSLAGAAIVAVLTAGMVTLKPILLAAAAGFALGLPVALLLARRLQG